MADERDPPAASAPKAEAAAVAAPVGGGQPRLDLSIGALVGANLLALGGVVLLGWDTGAILLLYWAENIVIGAYSLLRILLAAGGAPSRHVEKAFLAPFFVVHYGGFCAVHGIFVGVFVRGMGGGAPAAPFPEPGDWPGPLMFVGLLAGVIRSFWENHGQELLWPLAALAVSHGVSFVQNFIVRGEYRTASPKLLMAAPYGRIVLLHVTLIFGGMPVMLLGSPLPLVAILVVLKVVAEVHLHRRLHGAWERPALSAR